jgi:hypothetical protein
MLFPPFHSTSNQIIYLVRDVRDPKCCVCFECLRANTSRTIYSSSFEMYEWGWMTFLFLFAFLKERMKFIFLSRSLLFHFYKLTVFRVDTHLFYVGLRNCV